VLFGLLAVTVMLFPARMNAQGYGSILGTVTDASGASVPGASVTVTQTDTGRQTKVETGAAGTFVFPTLPPSGYSLKVAHNRSGERNGGGHNDAAAGGHDQ
jgi:hypothetical protein